MNIRKARPGEAGLLSDLAMRSKAYWGYSKEFMESCREELSVTPESIVDSGYHHRVAQIRDEIVGFYTLAQLPRSRLELDALFVAPGHIGRGIGKALMVHAITRAAEAGGRELIIQGDPNAYGFYQAAGGILAGKRESGSIPGRFLPLFKIALNPQTNK